MDKFTLTITLGNDAMSEPEHVAEALRSIAAKIDGGRHGGFVLDDNGNTVGEWEIA